MALVCFGADCTTLLLFDPVRQAIAAVHAGWRGTALGIAYKAVLRMQTEFGCAPEHIRAAIGPCIGRCCFEVGPEVPGGHGRKRSARTRRRPSSRTAKNRTSI